MKLLFSSLLFALAAASKQEGRGLQQQPTSATALRERWDMAAPKIVYDADGDKFALTFMTASDENYNAGLAATFWNPDCMASEQGVADYSISTELIHQVDIPGSIPVFEMIPQVPQGLRPQLEFQIDPGAFAAESSNIPDIYSGATPSCDISGTPYSELLRNMECPADNLFEVQVQTKDQCYRKCEETSDCTQFSFSGDGSCIGCKGTAASLVRSVDMVTYELCDGYSKAFDIAPYQGSAPTDMEILLAALASCTETTKMVSLGLNAVGSVPVGGSNPLTWGSHWTGTIDQAYAHQLIYVPTLGITMFSYFPDTNQLHSSAFNDPPLVKQCPIQSCNNFETYVLCPSQTASSVGTYQIPTPTDALDSCTESSTAVSLGENAFGPCEVDNTNDVVQSVSSLEDCHNLCVGDSDCVMFTYDSVGNKCSKCPLGTHLVNPNPSTTYETHILCPTPTAPSSVARIDFCVRSSLGYTISGTSDYQEVNFVETLVRIEYDMSSGFEVASFSVAPKNRELTTISESYEDALTAYLCDTSAGNVGAGGTYTVDSTESYPKASSTADPFNQGALITVCVRVKDEFASQKIVLKELTDFSWSRSGGTTFNRAIGGVGDDVTTITQVAITGSEAAGNYLTSYDKTNCVNKYWCQFASVLFAQFYNTPGTVTGTGDAILQFKTTRNRRLGEGVDERSLQGDPGSAGMDISIDVNGVAEGPGDLKTASGPSFGATTVSVSVVTALVGAILLA